MGISWTVRVLFSLPVMGLGSSLIFHILFPDLFAVLQAVQADTHRQHGVWTYSLRFMFHYLKVHSQLTGNGCQAEWGGATFSLCLPSPVQRDVWWKPRKYGNFINYVVLERNALFWLGNQLVSGGGLPDVKKKKKRVWIILKTVPKNKWGIYFWCFCIFTKEPIPRFGNKQMLIISFIPSNWGLISLEKNLHLVKSKKLSCFFLRSTLAGLCSCPLRGCGGASEVPGLLVCVYREASGSPRRVGCIRLDLFLFHKGLPGASSVITLLLGRQRRSKWGSARFIKSDKENRAPPSALATFIFT